MARTGRRIEQASSDEDAGLWQRPKRQGKNVGCVRNNSFIIGHSNEHINRTYDVRHLYVPIYSKSTTNLQQTEQQQVRNNEILQAFCTTNQQLVEQVEFGPSVRPAKLLSIT